MKLYNMVLQAQAQLNAYQQFQETNEFMASVDSANKAIGRLEAALPTVKIMAIQAENKRLTATAGARDQLAFGAGAVGDKSAVQGMRASLDADYASGRA